SRSKVYRGKVVSHLTGVISAVRAVFEPEASEVVRAPALGRPVVEEGASGVVARRHDRGVNARSEIYGRQCVAHLARGVAEIELIAKAKPTLKTDAPALERIVVEDRAHVHIRCCQGFGSAPRPQLYGRKA